MSRLYLSNLPDANKPRGGTSGLWSSLTTDDLPMPEYPETSTNSGRPPATMRSKAARRVSISDARPYNFSGISSRSGVSCSPSGNSSNRPRYTVQPLCGRHRLSRDVGVHQFHRIGRREWKSPGDHLVERYPERIEV